jgi:signal peptidase I
MTPGRRTAHRELTDFLAFALAIVFLVRTFVGEPFGVPTGSMAPTLLGAHKLVHCPECGKTFPVGADEPEHPPVLCRCPACETTLDIADAPVKPGNRIIVLKGPPTPLKRWDVAVFKFPDEPQKFYVKRIVGLPGERLRIKAGEIELWDEENQKWAIARKPAELAKQMAIPVWEQEFQKTGMPEAWDIWTRRHPETWEKTGDGWIANIPGGLSFHHRSGEGIPLLVGDELAYNLGMPSSQAANSASYWDKPSNPVGDLHLAFTMESLGQWPHINVVQGRVLTACQLELKPPMIRLHSANRVGEWRRPSRSSRRNIYFAYVDRRILLWVDDELLADWPDDEHQDEERQFPSEFETGFLGGKISWGLWPVKISSEGTPVRLTNLRVSRDVYYTQQAGATDFLATEAGREMMGDVKEFKRFRDARQRAREFVVPKGGYFALGDNSTRSLDGRHWQRGPFVNERLIVGRVLFKLGR